MENSTNVVRTISKMAHFETTGGDNIVIDTVRRFPTPSGQSRPVPEAIALIRRHAATEHARRCSQAKAPAVSRNRVTTWLRGIAPIRAPAAEAADIAGVIASTRIKLRRPTALLRRS